MCGSRPSFFVLGPVDKLVDKFNKMSMHIPEEAMDATFKWGTVGMVKHKYPHTEMENTCCTLVYVGSSHARRSSEARGKRRAAEIKRRRK